MINSKITNRFIEKFHVFAVAEEAGVKISLEQWKTLVAIVDAGGYAAAAERLGKSQSTLSYAIQKIESSFELQVFTLQGRRAVLTAAGELLYRRANQLLQVAKNIEQTAQELSSTWQSRLSIAVDAVFPRELLFKALAAFSVSQPLTRVDIQQTALSGANDLLYKGKVSLAISSMLSAGFVGEPILQVNFVAVAAPEHPLHQLPAPLSFTQLRQYRQLVVRDSGQQDTDVGWLDADQRWTFSHPEASLDAALAGLGFAWYPEHMVEKYIAAGRLKPLPLVQGAWRHSQLYLIYADNDLASLADVALGQQLLQHARLP